MNFTGGKIWHLLCFSSYLTAGYWLLPLSSKSVKSHFVVTVTPDGCRLDFDVTDSLQDLRPNVIAHSQRQNATLPTPQKKKKNVIPLVLRSSFLIVLAVRATGFMWTVCAANVILHWAVSLTISHEEKLQQAGSAAKAVFKHVSIEITWISTFKVALLS